MRVTNQGGGVVDNNAVDIVDSVPANTRTVRGRPGRAGQRAGGVRERLAEQRAHLDLHLAGSLTDDIDFSNDGGVTWTYVPTVGADGSDAAVNAIRLRPKGTMPGNGGGNPYFELQFRVVVN